MNPAVLYLLEYIQRGEAYIDCIAKTFESRNYICLITALLTVLAMKITFFSQTIYSELVGIAAGSLVIFLYYRFTKGKTIDHICTIQLGKIEVRGAGHFVNGSDFGIRPNFIISKQVAKIN